MEGTEREVPKIVAILEALCWERKSNDPALYNPFRSGENSYPNSVGIGQSEHLFFPLAKGQPAYLSFYVMMRHAGEMAGGKNQAWSPGTRLGCDW